MECRCRRRHCHRAPAAATTLPANALPRRCHRCQRAANATVALPAATALLPRCPRRRRAAAASASASASAAATAALPLPPR